MVALEQLNEYISNCHLCPLNDNWHLPVPGIGVANPDLFILAEAPAEIESNPSLYTDGFGVPLVGPAGTALQDLMAELGFKGLTYFITNVVKHRPPQNRPPTPQEKTICSVYLVAQLGAVQPKTILALGKHASETLRAIGGLPTLAPEVPHRGKHFTFQIKGSPHTTKVFSTYHPSYALLRNPSKEPDLRSDLEEVLEYVRRLQ